VTVYCSGDAPATMSGSGRFAIFRPPRPGGPPLFIPQGCGDGRRCILWFRDLGRTKQGALPISADLRSEAVSS
jgi:hypothetical protein